MSNLANRTNAPTDLTFSREQVETIKQTVARGATDSQLALFLQTCKSRNLDPFTKQVYFTPQGIIVSIDGFRSIAERTGAYAPGPTRYEYDTNGGLVAAYVAVKKLVAGTWFDVEESAFLDEYRGTSPIWRKMPRVMLAKCAEARALRRAFSSDLSGLYAQEEMDQAGVQPPPEVIVNPPAPAPVQTVAVVPVNKGNPEVMMVRADIENANSESDLRAVAVTIRGLTLTDAERGELRDAYVARKAMIGGAK
jgi:phage recombination protein Bet